MTMMFRAFECYRNLYNKCFQTLNTACINEQCIEENETNIEYLNIKIPYNLEYFLIKFKRILGRSKTSRIRIHLFTITFGFTICIILILISIVQVLSGTSISEFQRDPQSIVILIDLLIVALPVIAILIIVAGITHTSTNELIKLLRRVQLEAARDENLYTEGDNDGNNVFGKILMKSGNALRYLESTTEYTAAISEEYQIRLFGVIGVDRSLVMKIIALASSTAVSKLFRLLQESGKNQN